MSVNSGLAAMLLCLVLTGAPENGGDANAKIKELEQQRLKAATTARDYLVQQWRADPLVTAVSTNGFLHQMFDANKLVLQCRLDLCNAKADRIKAIEDSIKEFEPIVAQFEKHFQARIVDATVPYHLSLVQLLEMKIALEKAKQ